MTQSADPARSAPDLRVLVVGAAAWVAALATWNDLGPGVLAVAALLAGSAGVLRRGRRPWITVAGAGLAAVAALGSVTLTRAAVEHSPVHGWAATGSSVTAVVQLRTDPVLRPGRFETRATAEAVVREVAHHGRVLGTRAPVLVVLSAGDRMPLRGAVLRVAGTLRPSDRPERAAVLVTRSEAVLLADPSGLTAAGNRVRAGVREAVAGEPPGPRALVPALVAGQDGELPERVADDFRTAGMTHLLAVSGTNLTLIVGFLLVLARAVGVRAYGLVAVGLVGVGGFLVLAGGEPSVLRAAAMGTIALVGLASGGRERGVRALGVGVLVLVLVDPRLARSLGFALSVLATGAILLLAPRYRDALARWMPRWLAEAVAVPLAAQLVCTPLVAAISGEVSLVAVLANVLAAPLVAPATVLGLVAGLVAVPSPAAGHLVAVPAAWSARGLIAVAEHAAALPAPAVAWSAGTAGVVVLVLLCAALGTVLHRLLVHRGASVLAAALLLAAMVVPLPTPGWPPPGWVLVMCSVGQGDAIVLRVADGSAVVVDAGPDPEPVDRCLRTLGIREVPVVVLTHFHADHVDGLGGVLGGRRVGEIVTSPLADPPSGAAAVLRAAQRARVPVRVASPGEVRELGVLRWQVLGPTDASEPDSESPPNDASVVLLVEVAGIRVLLTGDQERPSQASLRRAYPGLRADVLKVAHHGSSKQDEALVEGLGARLALISVGRDNDYGHPAAATLDLLRGAGAQVHRTDREGDLAVVVGPSGALGTVGTGPVRGP